MKLLIISCLIFTSYSANAEIYSTGPNGEGRCTYVDKGGNFQTEGCGYNSPSVSISCDFNANPHTCKANGIPGTFKPGRKNYLKVQDKKI